ncbi:YdaU family protein [Aerolutibacter daejeonensis]|uniref:YdaU family protein n=1 Tax=Aerolutibacter daejeonensis TaxID=346181 RepID=UPI0018DCC320|nr:YdaU family protein [Lysobacter daejeonensis]
MNYFELHIGDYETATAHLTACEDGMYGRLLRRYYSTEVLLPLDMKVVQRLARARSREEKIALETVLNEFFIQAADGWRHKRCEEEISRYQEKRAKAKRSAELRWQSEGNANAHAPTMRMHSKGNALQTPETSRQLPEAHEPHIEALAPPAGRTSASISAATLTKAGVRVTSQNPDLIAACVEGVTTEHLLEVAGLFPGKPAGYVIATARRENAERAESISRNITSARGNGQLSKTLTGLARLEKLKHAAQSELASDRDRSRTAEALPTLSRTFATNGRD